MDVDTVHTADRRVRSRPGAATAARLAGGAVAGMRAGARHEHRQQVRRVASVLSVLGLREGIASRLVLMTWAALAVVTVLGAQAPPLRTAVPSTYRWLVPAALLTVLCLLGLGFARHLVRVERDHRTLLLALPARTRRGLVAGLSLTYVPVIMVSAGQVARGGLSDLPASLGALVETVLGAAVGETSASRTLPWAAAAAVVVSTGLATSRASRWIGAHGLGPRVPAAHRWAGRTVAVLLALGWVAATALGPTGRFAALGQHVLLAAALLATLLLRARHVRFVSPETFGYGLRLAERAGADPRRLAALSRRNAVLLLVPAPVGAALLLVLHGSGFAVVLLAALVLFELALAEFIVQRSTVVLPASRLAELTVTSRAGLAATVCLGVVFTTTGSGGLFAILDFDAHRTTVVAASLLLTASAVTIAWLVRIDTPRWLTGLRATSGSLP